MASDNFSLGGQRKNCAWVALLASRMASRVASCMAARVASCVAPRVASQIWLVGETMHAPDFLRLVDLWRQNCLRSLRYVRSLPLRLDLSEGNV